MSGSEGGDVTRLSEDDVARIAAKYDPTGSLYADIYALLADRTALLAELDLRTAERDESRATALAWKAEAGELRESERELLAALEGLCATTTVDQDGNYHSHGDSWRRAHDAIARARGEAVGA